MFTHPIREEEIKLLAETADIGRGYAQQLIAWFETAEIAIVYLVGDDAKKHLMLRAAQQLHGPASQSLLKNL